jgi:hypothetical protein
MTALPFGSAIATHSGRLMIDYVHGRHGLFSKLWNGTLHCMANQQFVEAPQCRFVQSLDLRFHPLALAQRLQSPSSHLGRCSSAAMCSLARQQIVQQHVSIVGIDET